MCSKQEFVVQLFLLLILGQEINATMYRFEPENEELFTDCPNQPSNVLNINGFYDMSNVTFTLNMDSITISGNAMLVWNVVPGDRIQIHAELLRNDRGTWLSTAFALKIMDFCPIMFDKNQYWYSIWTKHIMNADEFKGTCPLASTGSTIIQETFDIVMKFDLMTIVPMSGRYKLQLILKAFDKTNVERKTRICIDIIGEMVRAN